MCNEWLKRLKACLASEDLDGIGLLLDDFGKLEFESQAQLEEALALNLATTKLFAQKKLQIEREFEKLNRAKGYLA